MDHFTYAPVDGTLSLRVFTCNPTGAWVAGNPVFWYVGNEADVELYVNHTGAMWENALEFSALLIFAEHRYYGQSKPVFSDGQQHLAYLSSEQALADNAQLTLSPLP